MLKFNYFIPQRERFVRSTRNAKTEQARQLQVQQQKCTNEKYRTKLVRKTLRDIWDQIAEVENVGPGNARRTVCCLLCSVTGHSLNNWDFYESCASNSAVATFSVYTYICLQRKSAWSIVEETIRSYIKGSMLLSDVHLTTNCTIVSVPRGGKCSVP